GQALVSSIDGRDSQNPHICRRCHFRFFVDTQTSLRPYHRMRVSQLFLAPHSLHSLPCHDQQDAIYELVSSTSFSLPDNLAIREIHHLDVACTHPRIPIPSVRIPLSLHPIRARYSTPR
ncbi:hypothetical protein PMAYCL1PPCAC_09981, partial [Pristionchus mayeri]